MRFTSKGIIVAVALAACGAVVAQPSPEQMRRGRKMVEERFLAEAPEIGQPAPDVAVLDADGKEHQLQTLLKGNYSVLVLGCLT